MILMSDLGQPDWLTSPATRAVIAALEAARPGCARFVGGCVRNTLMGRPVDDIDIATQLTPDLTIKALEAAGLRAIPTGIEHGTVTAISDHIPYEITTLRRDVETDGRRAVVAFTEDWAEDAQRRDFRLNALYAEPDGTLHDPVGGGLEDAETGRVIFIGDGDERLREDYLRILRFFRFNAWYGAGIDAEGLAACARQKDGLEKIAAERIWKELKKLLAAPEPVEAVSAMEASGVLGKVLPDARGETALELAAARSPDPMVRLMTLLPKTVLISAEISDRLRLSNAEQNRLKAWEQAYFEPEDAGDNAALQRAFYTYGAEAIADSAALEASVTDATFEQVSKLAQAWERPSFPVNGNDALKLGLSGEVLGVVLKAAETWWVAEDFRPDRQATLAHLEKLAKAATDPL